MRIHILILSLVSFFTLVAAWSKEDYEIFDLVTAVENSEGKDTTFYSWLGVPEKASSIEIQKAYRKKSLELHPDKNYGVPGANERYARLGVVAQILRSEGRERYDFWMKRGVPKWRGTGYYYSRFRPGLGTVLVFLTLLTSSLQHLVHRMTYKSELARVRRFVYLARKAAWGTKYDPKNPEFQPPAENVARKVRVNIRGNGDFVEGEEQEYLPGRMVDMLVQGDRVYLLDGGERHVLDESVPLKPTFSRTWPVALVNWLVGRVRGERAEAETEAEVEVDAEGKVEGYEVKEGGDAEGDNVASRVNGRTLRARPKARQSASASATATATATSNSSSSDDEQKSGGGGGSRRPVAAVKAGGRRKSARR
ncbi:hypothetical protein FRB91_011980 [Serendipita sp. 411]|nr:hypothetical protein FRC16_006945 [Serendipita sp. 398]KAG8847228.1 hypothetical protein FRB91_011980 [Serendipita sp. 411]